MINLDKPWRRVRANATLAYLESLDDEQITSLFSQLEIQLNRKPTYAEIKAAADFDLPTGLVDVRLHDLRRTVGSWLAQAGNSLHLIGRVLNHSNQSTTAIYARFAQDQVRDAMEQHGKRIMGVADMHPTAEIVPIKRSWWNGPKKRWIQRAC